MPGVVLCFDFLENFGSFGKQTYIFFTEKFPFYGNTVVVTMSYNRISCMVHVKLLITPAKTTRGRLWVEITV